jgi:uncharacterized protein YfaS (alpha-2-macroglobulin family)
MLPLTLRQVQGELRPGGSGGQVRILRLGSDGDILSWYAQVRKLDRDHGERGRSLLRDQPAARRLELPQLLGGEPKPFEVIGIPLNEPGYHVVEVESLRLGESLLDKKAPMFVRTGVLVTNLGVHFKRGRENGVVWVTTLDRARPVPDADVAISDCKGRPKWQGRTDAQGLAFVTTALDSLAVCDGDAAWFVSARKTGANGVTDTAFVYSHWQKGIEPWRFNVASNSEPELEGRAHSVLDRSLLRAGETVAMKHFIRTETSTGLAEFQPGQLPDRVKLVHQGSGQEFAQSLQWQGVRSATSTWRIPDSARLGMYDVLLERGEPGDARGGHRSWHSGSFRVEEFRLPLVDARLAGPASVVAPRSLPLTLQLHYLSGGAVANAQVRASALWRDRSVHFADHDEFSFAPPREPQRRDEADLDGAPTSGNGRLIADGLLLTTDAHGAATLELKDLPAVHKPVEVAAEVTFDDPNGEAQTVSTRIALWPGAVVAGIKADSWASNRGKVTFTALALDTQGRPLKGQALEVRGRQSKFISSRKRMVGGFYAYDNRTEVNDIGVLCSGSSDERGRLDCVATLATPGQVELIASARDAQSRVAQAATSVWITRQGELWFAQDNDDRIDVLPEKKQYEPGETARLQVRMPFREATALVAVEREGVIATRLVTLRGDDPTIDLKIEKNWGPNVFVSVLALRGRIREVPWTSFFTWGWKEPIDWMRSFIYENRAYQAPTAMVDLSRPAFKLGVAALKVGLAEHELQVSVRSDKPQYQVREKALAHIRVTHAGKPLAGAEVAFAAVDESLLALRDNATWDLLRAMVRERAWGVETSTAHSEIIGRRHYGRKALAAGGGGGGRGGTRELFDTLLLWQARVPLDANGEAQVEVPLNDSLTSFRLVAIADAGTQLFGTGHTSIRVTQDLQVLAGLPPLVRDGDRFDALLTLRNTTAREMRLIASLRGVVHGGDTSRMPLDLTPQSLVLAPGAAKELSWTVLVPAQADSIAWEASAEEERAPKSGVEPARDRVKLKQRAVPAVPLRVMQATLQQLDGTISLPAAAPADAMTMQDAQGNALARGGLQVSLQPRLSGALPGIRRYFETYPFACLEQKVSKAVGLGDTSGWAAVANALPTYLDSDGLANYFPQRSSDRPHGSDRLTAYLLAATHEAGFELPMAAREAMLAGLAAFVEGRIERRTWSPASARAAERDVRKIAALEALSRHGRATPGMLGSIRLAPDVWPTAAVIDWLNILRRVDGIPARAQRLSEAQQILRSRLTYAGTTLKFSNEESDFWWWLMDSADANAGRLVLAVLDDPAWRDELPRMVVGSLGRQRGGAWLTTTANLWGALALSKFSARFEAEPVAGKTLTRIRTTEAEFDWSHQAEGGAMMLPWPAAPEVLNVLQQGAGRPWLSVHSLAAVPLKSPIRAGYGITRSVSAVVQKDKSRWSRGDIVRVRLEIDAQSDMSWVVLSDPVPGGATLLGSGLGRDSALATRGERREGSVWPAFEERSFAAYRSYFEVLPRGRHVVEYTMRLNNPGRFTMPPSRVEAMYAPESFGEVPVAPLEVAP